MFQLISESIGFLCAVLTKQLQMAIIVNTFVLLVMLSFSGFLLTKVSWKGRRAATVLPRGIGSIITQGEPGPVH